MYISIKCLTALLLLFYFLSPSLLPTFCLPLHFSLTRSFFLFLIRLPISRHRELFFAFYFFEYFSFLCGSVCRIFALCLAHVLRLFRSHSSSTSYGSTCIYLLLPCDRKKGRARARGGERERVRVSLVHIRIVSIWLSKGTFAVLKLLLFSSHRIAEHGIVVACGAAAAAAVVIAFLCVVVVVAFGFVSSLAFIFFRVVYFISPDHQNVCVRVYLFSTHYI